MFWQHVHRVVLQSWNWEARAREGGIRKRCTGCKHVSWVTLCNDVLHVCGLAAMKLRGQSAWRWYMWGELTMQAMRTGSACCSSPLLNPFGVSRSAIYFICAVFSFCHYCLGHQEDCPYTKGPVLRDTTAVRMQWQDPSPLVLTLRKPFIQVFA